MTTIKMLIIEDEMLIAMRLRKKFIEMGYHVCSLAATGRKALEIAEREQPDVVLVDIKLSGGMSGIEAAQKLHDRFGIPFVYATGYESQEIMDQAMATNPLGYFLKPLRCEEISQTIQAALLHDPGTDKA
ncbi:response regulator [candidate division KSB3 bacterium]|uniref:Response regulator n=1 Tax=candidate division KSB3 bacterium TaxID=2044937 RepID=A0A9D5JW56_9BACT|nr:response regulator [candidate division KSB3 bacterium]MBD3325234.1 response regulator [candidate division KSB3 bacterium]